jgi:methyl-accepting chemotaxis protein
MEEMGRIEQESQRALEAMQRLALQTGEVVKIIEVIKELVSDTELLAFNAAIIAAKAGEEGRGFAVVAEEIRDLADRTTTSAQDIHRIIQAIGGDTREVLEAVEATGMRIAKGKQLSLSTGEALRKIVGSSGQATATSEEIAGLTGQQAERARALLADAGGSLRSIRGITRAMQEQQLAITRIQGGVGQMKVAADQIARSMEEQVRANRQFDAGLAERQEQVRTINEATAFQMATAQRVFGHFAASEQRLQGNAERSAVITAKIAELEVLAGSLRTLIETFEQPRGGRAAVPPRKPPSRR